MSPKLGELWKKSLLINGDEVDCKYFVCVGDNEKEICLREVGKDYRVDTYPKGGKYRWVPIVGHWEIQMKLGPAFRWEKIDP